MAIFSIFSVGTSFQLTSVLVYPMSKRLGRVYSVSICMLDRSVHVLSSHAVIYLVEVCYVLIYA